MQPLLNPPFSQTYLGDLFESLVTSQSSIREAGFKQGKFTLRGITMRFASRFFGQRPEDGFSLYIGLHGGGALTSEENDLHWENHKNLYILPEGSVWVVPRAPEDVSNMWSLPYIDDMLDYLIQSYVILKIANPNKVFLTGYAAGGDGVYRLAPRMADRFAAAAMMGGHPGNVSVLSLRNLPFAIQVGELDEEDERNKKAYAYGKRLKNLHIDDQEGYLHYVEIHPGCEQWMFMRDEKVFQWLKDIVRNPYPRVVVWKQCAETLHTSFYWLAVPPSKAKRSSLIVAEHNGNCFFIESKEVDEVIIRLNDEFVDLNQKIQVHFNNSLVFDGKVERSQQIAQNTLLERQDPFLIFTAEVNVKAKQPLNSK